MTIGDKIKKYRKLKGLTQKELGVMVGFKESTADVRINQYEQCKMRPKERIKGKIAECLDIDGEALSQTEIVTIYDVMYVLFELEEIGFKVDKHNDEITLNYKSDNSELYKLMEYWLENKDTLNYETWKARFVSNFNNLPG